MSKLIFLILFFITNLVADNKIYEDEKIFTITVENESYKELLINLKDEIIHQSFTIVHELDLAKSTNKVAKALKKKEILKNGRNILMCKTSFTLEMIEENIDNITYCPLSISIYEKNHKVFISYKKYSPFKKNNLIAIKINEKLKNLILNSLN